MYNSSVLIFKNLFKAKNVAINVSNIPIKITAKNTTPNSSKSRYFNISAASICKKYRMPAVKATAISPLRKPWNVPLSRNGERI